MEREVRRGEKGSLRLCVARNDQDYCVKAAWTLDESKVTH